LKHKRLSKHELREDNFVTAVLRAREFIFRHQNAFFVGVLAVIVIIAGVMWISSSRGKSREAAATQFAEAITTFRAGDIKSAEEMFRAINERFGGLEEGSYAAYLAGKCALEDGRNTHAIELFGEYLKSSKKYPFFHDAAIEGMAVAWENEGDYTKASELYLKLVEDTRSNSFMEASYLRKAADALKRGGMRDRAIEVLERLSELSSGLDKRDIDIEIKILRG
jgi:tetratricopeptide (TPR) repeat protein